MDFITTRDIISKPWLCTEDIMILACSGRHTATKIREQAEKKVIDEGYFLPQSKKKYVPTNVVLDILGLSADMIFEMANMIEQKGESSNGNKMCK